MQISVESDGDHSMACRRQNPRKPPRSPRRTSGKRNAISGRFGTPEGVQMPLCCLEDSPEAEPTTPPPEAHAARVTSHSMHLRACIYNIANCYADFCVQYDYGYDHDSQELLLTYVMGLHGQGSAAIFSSLGERLAWHNCLGLANPQTGEAPLCSCLYGMISAY